MGQTVLHTFTDPEIADVHNNGTPSPGKQLRVSAKLLRDSEKCTIPFRNINLLKSCFLAFKNKSYMPVKSDHPK